MTTHPYRFDGLPPIHPGAHLHDDLEALGMSAAELARRLKVPTNRVTAILNGQRAVTADTALRLGRFFGTGPEFWLRLQERYELKKAIAARPTEIESIEPLKPVEGQASKAPGRKSA